jgi:hypothetical protein
MFNLIGMCLVVVAVLWITLILLKNYGLPLLAKTGVSVPASVTSTVEKIDDYADIVAGMSAAFALTAIAKKRGNQELATQVAAVRVTLAKLADDSVTPAA